MSRHCDETTGFILASSEPCLTIRKEELARVRRRLVSLEEDALETLELPKSWLLAIIVCPGDRIDVVAAWVAARLREANPRVRFYVHPDTDVVEAFKPWYAAALPDPYTADVTDFKSFHKQFGWDLNMRIFDDANDR